MTSQPLTPKQLEALRSLREQASNPFAFGSTTVNLLCKTGLAERIHHDVGGRKSTTLHITPNGLARLALAEMMKPAQIIIRIRHDSDWGCDYTPADAAAYEAAVSEEILSVYPGAEIDISMGLGPAKVAAFHADVADEDEIESTCREILQGVFDRGDFWPSEPVTHADPETGPEALADRTP